MSALMNVSMCGVMSSSVSVRDSLFQCFSIFKLLFCLNMKLILSERKRLNCCCSVKKARQTAINRIMKILPSSRND